MSMTQVLPGTPSLPTTSLGALQCVSGTVTLFTFIVQPQPGSIIGQIQPTFGAPIPLTQTQPTPLGGTPLTSVNGRFATLCGQFRAVGGQTALDVVVVNPGAPSPTGTPVPNQLLLLLLILLLTNPQLAGTLLPGVLSATGLSSFQLQQIMSQLLSQPGILSSLGGVSGLGGALSTSGFSQFGSPTGI